MDKIIVIGGGGHAKVIISILKKLKSYEVSGYIDKIDKGKILNVNYLGNDGITEGLFKEKNVKNAVIGIGHLKHTDTIQKIYAKLSKIGFSFPIIISPDSIVNEDVKISEGTVVMDGVIVNSGTKIGKFCILNTKSSIDHDCEIGNFVHIAPGVTLSGGVKIGNNSLIGSGATVIQYKTIEDNCIIGAGTVVVKDCLKSGTYVGIPARLSK